jgi:hypothetical protein
VKSGSGDHTVYHSGGERAGRGIAIVVHKSIMRSVVNKNVSEDKIIALKFKAELVYILSASQHRGMKMMKGKNCKK